MSDEPSDTELHNERSNRVHAEEFTAHIADAAPSPCPLPLSTTKPLTATWMGDSGLEPDFIHDWRKAEANLNI